MSAIKPSTIQINEDRYYVGEFKLKWDLMYVSQNSLIRPRFQFGKVDQKREISFWMHQSLQRWSSLFIILVPRIAQNMQIKAYIADHSKSSSRRFEIQFIRGYLIFCRNGKLSSFDVWRLSQIKLLLWSSIRRLTIHKQRCRQVIFAF